VSADPQANRDRRWTRWELVGLIVVIWFLAVLFFLLLTATP
jgi:hypothetical protein